MTNKNSNPFSNDDIVKDEENKQAEEVKAEQEDTNAEETSEETKQDSELQEKYDKLNQQYIRLAADFDNYRKRQEQEKEALLKYGAESTLKKMIEVLDNFERGRKAFFIGFVHQEDCLTGAGSHTQATAGALLFLIDCRQPCDVLAHLDAAEMTCVLARVTRNILQTAN